MGLVYAGIDEAGYGPLLGPLCVGMAVFMVDDWSPSMGPPDLWSRLERGVCTGARDPRGRVAIADSKRLKLPNSSARRHPLVQLERGVLAFSGLFERDIGFDSDLFEMLGASVGALPWYRTSPTALPLGSSAEEIRIAANLLRRACREAGVELAAMRCLALDEGSFNEIVRREGTKAATTLDAIGRHLRWVCDRPWAHADEIRIVSDRLGGRRDYRSFLAGALGFGEHGVRVVEESARVSAYEVDLDGRSIGVQFRPECESAHLPVALASMVAKYVRELMMARFNAYWCARDPSLKRTAGYRQDARRWLDEAGHLLTDEDRVALIRLA